MVVLPRVIVMPLVSGSHVTVEPKVSAMKRIGTKVRPAALILTVTVVVRPAACAETVPVSAALYVRRPCAGATLKTAATRSVSVQTACCLLYTSDAADDLLCVDLGGR